MPAIRKLPLSGVRIADLTQNWAGPHATRILADFGAEVIKIEYVRRMDGLRGAGKENQAYDHHPRWLEVNRNKKSITLDLKRPTDVEVLKDLVKISDVVTECSRVGVLDKFGLGYEELKKLRPGLIMLSMPGYGSSGPDAQCAAYGGTLEALSGIHSLTAYQRTSKPMRIKEVDVTSGVAGACAVMTALIYRQRTGKGQWIDLSQLEAATSCLIGEHLLEFVMNGKATLPLGNRDARNAPQGCYPCRGDDKWVAISIRSDEEWLRLCNAMRRPELAEDPRFRTAAGRLAGHDQIDGIIGAWTAQWTHYEAMKALQAAGIAAGAVLNVAEIAEDTHLKYRGFFHEAEDGTGRYPGMPFVLPRALPEVRNRGPRLGEHDEEVRCGLLGRPKEEIEPITVDKIGTAFEIE